MKQKNKPKNIVKHILDEIVRRICRTANPQRIILFGSAATETMTVDSDLDLLVIKDGFKNQGDENLRLWKYLHGIEAPVDIFAMTPKRFDETKDVIGGLAYPANKYGKVIY